MGGERFGGGAFCFAAVRTGSSGVHKEICGTDGCQHGGNGVDFQDKADTGIVQGDRVSVCVCFRVRGNDEVPVFRHGVFT